MPQKIKGLKDLINELKIVQLDFLRKFGVNDIISNSKVFEVIIGNALGHILIPGHSGSRDAKNKDGGEYEYKHYKESSSNHTWTFNDYTDATIAKLRSAVSVIFAHIEDSGLFPRFDWYYEVPGHIIADYLKLKTKGIKNNRKMVNVSAKQIEDYLKINKSHNNAVSEKGRYYRWIKEIFDISIQIEEITGTKGILTSNKLWEILVAAVLGHTVLSEQAGHDAVDDEGNFYEYKVAKSHSWNFQDISKEVLEKYKLDKQIILAVADKDDFKVIILFACNSLKTVRLLKKKLKEKNRRFRARGEKVRRLQVSLSNGDVIKLGAKIVYRP